MIDSRNKRIDKFDLDGNFIESYKSIKTVKELFGINPTKVLRGVGKTAGGFIWKYNTDKI